MQRCDHRPRSASVCRQSLELARGACSALRTSCAVSSDSRRVGAAAGASAGTEIRGHSVQTSPAAANPRTERRAELVPITSPPAVALVVDSGDLSDRPLRDWIARRVPRFARVAKSRFYGEKWVIGDGGRRCPLVRSRVSDSDRTLADTFRDGTSTIAARGGLGPLKSL